MATMTKESLLKALRENVEGTVTTQTGERWGYVYLSNVGNTHQFAGFLSVLKKEGLYNPVDKYFGEVKLA